MVRNLAEDATLPESIADKDMTNVQMALLQQEMFFHDHWSRSLGHHDTGLCQLFLFTFGNYGLPVTGRIVSFSDKFARGLVAELIEVTLMSVGMRLAAKISRRRHSRTQCWTSWRPSSRYSESLRKQTLYSRVA